jgi:hypothetical protein
MTKQWKPGKHTVELNGPERPSRIRRVPATVVKPADGADKIEWWRSDEWEIKLAILGIIAFALAINVIIVAVSAYWN